MNGIITHTPSDEMSDQELMDFLTFYRDTRLFHLQIAHHSPPNSLLKTLHLNHARSCGEIAQGFEMILERRRQLAQLPTFLRNLLDSLGDSIWIN